MCQAEPCIDPSTAFSLQALMLIIPQTSLELPFAINNQPQPHFPFIKLCFSDFGWFATVFQVNLDFRYASLSFPSTSLFYLSLWVRLHALSLFWWPLLPFYLSRAEEPHFHIFHMWIGSCYWILKVYYPFQVSLKDWFYLTLKVLRCWCLLA